MPTFYEGSPIEAVEQTVSAADYASAYYWVQSSFSLLHRREVRAGICLTLAVIVGSMIPLTSFLFSPSPLETGRRSFTTPTRFLPCHRK